MSHVRRVEISLLRESGGGVEDVAVFHPGEGLWYLRRPSDGRVTRKGVRRAYDAPLSGDFDGDGKGDPMGVEPHGSLPGARHSAGRRTVLFENGKGV
jgi:hypothetical protein